MSSVERELEVSERYVAGLGQSGKDTSLVRIVLSAVARMFRLVVAHTAMVIPL